MTVKTMYRIDISVPKEKSFFNTRHGFVHFIECAPSGIWEVCEKLEAEGWTVDALQRQDFASEEDAAKELHASVVVGKIIQRSRLQDDEQPEGDDQ